MLLLIVEISSYFGHPFFLLPDFRSFCLPGSSCSVFGGANVSVGIKEKTLFYQQGAMHKKHYLKAVTRGIIANFDIPITCFIIRFIKGRYTVINPQGAADIS